MLQCQAVEIKQDRNNLERLHALDARLSQALHLSDTQPGVQRLFQVISHSGDSWYWLFGLIALWFVGRPLLKELALFWASGMVILAILVLGVKFLFRRPRPEGDWGQIYRNTDPHSFPSGHAARAMALAIMAQITGQPAFIVLMLVWAILVGLSRVALRLHYLSDVLVGWAIGVVAGLIFLNLWPAFSLWLRQLFPFLF